MIGLAYNINSLELTERLKVALMNGPQASEATYHM